MGRLVDDPDFTTTQGLAALTSPTKLGAFATYADGGQHVFGIEYMGAVFAKLRAAPATNLKITLRGDSTIVGTGSSTQDYQPQYLLSHMLAKRGVASTITNGGVGGKTSADWLNTYLPTDLLGTQPDVYLYGYFMNDPYFGISAAQSIVNLRAGLALLRASWPASQTAVIVKMPNTASDDAHNRNEANLSALAAGVRQACRDYGCVFVDVWGAFPEARQNLAANWLDVNLVHPNEDFYMVQWGMIADAIAPAAHVAMMSRPTLVTPLAGFSQGSEPLAVFTEGRLVSIAGFFSGSGVTIGNGVSIGSIPGGFRPLYSQWHVGARVWNGSTAADAANWQTLRCLLRNDGLIITMEASTLICNRFTLDGVTWRRT